MSDWGTVVAVLVRGLPVLVMLVLARALWRLSREFGAMAERYRAMADLSGQRLDALRKGDMVLADELGRKLDAMEGER